MSRKRLNTEGTARGAPRSRAEPDVRRFPAVEIRQGPRRVLYMFAVDGKELTSFATVARVRREVDSQAILGYQRPEVLSHIDEIRQYVESSDPMIPNAIVIAFNKSVRFEASTVQTLGPGYCRSGVLVVPTPADLADADKPGWIVDGQQRVAAVKLARVKQFPLCVTAFITDDEQEQRAQFILVNSTKPLPKGLIYELLPQTEARLPSSLQRKRFPALLLDRLNHDGDSPLRGMIRTPTSPQGVIKDNSVLKMLENSLGDGGLHQFRDSQSGGGNLHAMLAAQKAFWAAVRYVFAEAWGQPPTRSRLMHGTGIVAMGFLMDAMMDDFPNGYVPSEAEFRACLQRIAADCRWTRGIWKLPGGVRRKWNEIQNTPRDIDLISSYLLQQYRLRVTRPMRTKTSARAP